MEAPDVFFPSGNERDLVIRTRRSLHDTFYCTSIYNSRSVAFNLRLPAGLVGPSYKDFPENSILRTYGPWWIQSELCQSNYMPQDVDPLAAEEYALLCFQVAVIPRGIEISEFHNPGGIVRIWGRLSGQKWKLLWEGPAQIWPNRTRDFKPALRQINCLINEIRLEFNQSNLGYHTSIDGVHLVGYKPKYKILAKLLETDLSYWVSPLEITSDESEDFEEGENHSWKLPNEILFSIFRRLDLVSLSNCAQVCRRWNEVSSDFTMIQSLSLKKYWHMVTIDTLEFLQQRCRTLKKLDMSWCADVINVDEFSYHFIIFLRHCGTQLTHLSLRDTSFVTTEVIEEISNCTEIKELRLKSVTLNSMNSHFLARFTKLVTLDLSCTAIKRPNLVAILKANRNLRNINLDFCGELEYLQEIILVASEYNKNLTSWSSWKAVALTSTGASYFSRFPHLKELDLGWCFVFNEPGDCLKQIARGCRDLRRLVLSQWRSISYEILLTVVTNCKKLWFLNLLGIQDITSTMCELIFANLPELRLLDVSFCANISDDHVRVWREQYPDITIQRTLYGTIYSNMF